MGDAYGYFCGSADLFPTLRPGEDPEWWSGSNCGWRLSGITSSVMHCQKWMGNRTKPHETKHPTGTRRRPNAKFHTNQRQAIDGGG